MVIEIKYGYYEGDHPEHYGYYNNVEDAKRAIDEIEQKIERAILESED